MRAQNAQDPAHVVQQQSTPILDDGETLCERLVLVPGRRGCGEDHAQPLGDRCLQFAVDPVAFKRHRQTRGLRTLSLKLGRASFQLTRAAGKQLASRVHLATPRTEMVQTGRCAGWAHDRVLDHLDRHHREHEQSDPNRSVTASVSADGEREQRQRGQDLGAVDLARATQGHPRDSQAQDHGGQQRRITPQRHRERREDQRDMLDWSGRLRRPDDDRRASTELLRRAGQEPGPQRPQINLGVRQRAPAHKPQPKPFAVSLSPDRSSISESVHQQDRPPVVALTIEPEILLKEDPHSAMRPLPSVASGGSLAAMLDHDAAPNSGPDRRRPAAACGQGFG